MVMSRLDYPDSNWAGVYSVALIAVIVGVPTLQEEATFIYICIGSNKIEPQFWLHWVL